MDELTHGQGAAPMPLTDATLAALPEAIKRPTYDRRALTAGMVHIGLGNFHRAHQAWYLHRLMDMGLAHDWAIIGAGVRPHDAAQRSKLAKQDYLTTLIELDPNGSSAEVVGSMIGFLPVEDGNGALIRQMADPNIRIVSLTVTEGGYYTDPATKRFDPNHDDIVHDIENIDKPRTAFGAIVAALDVRRRAALGPFTCQSCDNLPGNGAILQEVVIGIASRVDQELGHWISQNVSFPNSMVDCIVPATGENELALVRKLGLDDRAPVTHENFRQWVIEDDFCAGRPDWERVGVTLSNDVHDYEAMKLRILNGGHQIIAAPAEILGIETIAQTMQHPQIGAFLRKVALAEIAPHVADVPDMTPAKYVDLIQQRFANPEIHDTVRRVAFDGASRHTGAVLPVIRDAVAARQPVSGLALSQALWARMCLGIREDHSTIEPNDPIWPALTQTAKAAQSNPKLWLQQRNLYGDLADNVAFRAQFSEWFKLIGEQGVEAALNVYLHGFTEH